MTAIDTRKLEKRDKELIRDSLIASGFTLANDSKRKRIEVFKEKTDILLFVNEKSSLEGVAEVLELENVKDLIELWPTIEKVLGFKDE